MSYGLRMLRTAGLVTFRKEGRVVYYSLAASFPHPLLEHCLRQLLDAWPPPRTSGESASRRSATRCSWRGR